MADTGEVNVKLKVTAETGGAAKVKAALESTGEAAKKAADKGKSAFAQVQSTMSGVTRAAGLFQKALAGFGLVGVITSIAGAVSKIRDSFRESTREAKEFEKAAQAKAVKESIDALAESYRKLTEAIGEANAARRHEQELDDIKLKNRRDAEDAALDLAEQKELAGIDANDPAAAEARAEIQARYQAERSKRQAERAKFDGDRERESLRSDAAAGRKEADAIDASLKDDDAAIAAAKRRRDEKRAASVNENEADDQGVWSNFASNVRKIVTLNWGKVGDNRTEEGNARRAEAQKEAEAEEERIKSLEKSRDEKAKRAEELRTEAARKEEKAEALGGSVEAQELRIESTRLANRQAIAAAERATDKKDADTKAEKEKYADAMTSQEMLAREKADIQSRLAELQARKDAAGMAVYQAQNSYDASKLGGNRAAQQSAFGNLQSARDAALEVDAAVDGTIKSLTETLKSVETRLKAAQNFMESQSKQTRFAWSEQPAAS